WPPSRPPAGSATKAGSATGRPPIWSGSGWRWSRRRPRWRAVEEREIGFQRLVLTAPTKHAVGSGPAGRGPPAGRGQRGRRGPLLAPLPAGPPRRRPGGWAGSRPKAIEARALRLNQRPATMSGILDPIGGGVPRAAREPLTRPSGQADTRGSAGWPAPVLDPIVMPRTVDADARGRERRLAGALVELAQPALLQSPPAAPPGRGAAPQPAQARVRPVLVVGARSARGQAGAAGRRPLS